MRGTNSFQIEYLLNFTPFNQQDVDVCEEHLNSAGAELIRWRLDIDLCYQQLKESQKKKYRTVSVVITHIAERSY